MLLVTLSCKDTNKIDNDMFTYYECTNDNGTAKLKFETTGNYWAGQYEIFYETQKVKDSGVIKGQIFGDTLKGTFNYLSYGGSWERKPVVFLRKKDSLITGSGIAIGYMSFVYFDPKVPLTFNNPDFILTKVKTK
jgi:hypothetical protein